MKLGKHITKNKFRLMLDLHKSGFFKFFMILPNILYKNIILAYYVVLNECYFPSLRNSSLPYCLLKIFIVYCMYVQWCAK